MECGAWADPAVDLTSDAWAWQFILDTLKVGNGEAHARTLSDARLIRCGALVGRVADQGRSILDSYIREGLVIEVNGIVTARSWSTFQKDDGAKKERDREWAASNRKKSPKVVTTPNDSSKVVASRSPTYTDTTTNTGTPAAAVVAETSRALPAGPSATTTASTSDPGFPDDFGKVEAAFRSTQSGRYAMTLSPADVAALVALTLTHGAGKVADACTAAAEGNNRERVSVAFLRAILENAGKPRGAKTAQAKPHGSHSIWEKHDMPIPQMTGGRMDEV